MPDIGRVPDLAHLSVGDEVDAGLDLAPDAVVDGGGDHALVPIAVDRLTAVDREHDVDDILRPGRLPT